MAEPLSLGQLGRVLFRYWILIVIGTLLGGGAAFGLTRFMTPVYRATAIQLVKGLPGSGAAANYEAAQYAVSRAKTYPSFVYSQQVLEGVRSDLEARGTTESIVQLREDLSATNPVDTPLLEITATGETREEARDKANSAARHMARFITQIETVGNKSPITVETAVLAALPTQAASPKTLVIAALGAMIGFALATISALINSYIRYQRRSAFRRKQRKQVVDWASGEAADMPAATPVTAAESPPQPYGAATAAAVASPPSQAYVDVSVDSAETGSYTSPDSEVSPAANGERSWDAYGRGHEYHEFLIEVDPHPTELRQIKTEETTAAEVDTIEFFGPIPLSTSGDSAEQTDRHPADSGDHAESVGLNDSQMSSLGDSADEAGGADHERDQIDALEHSGTWKQSARR